MGLHRLDLIIEEQIVVELKALVRPGVQAQQESRFFSVQMGEQPAQLQAVRLIQIIVCI